MTAHARNEPPDRPDRHSDRRPTRKRRRRLVVPDPPPASDLWARSDLRRREARSHTDDLLASTDVLTIHDAALLRAVLVDHIPMRELAALARTTARTVRRNVHALIQRVRSPEFRFVRAHGHAWPDQRRDVARAVFIHGHSLRRVTQDLRLSLHTVRRHVVSVAAMCEAARDLVTELAASKLADPHAGPHADPHADPNGDHDA